MKARGGEHCVSYRADEGEAAKFAATELARSLGAMIGETFAVAAGAAIARESLHVRWPVHGNAAAEIVLRAAPDGSVLHAAYEYLERLGARFPVGRAPLLPRIDRGRLTPSAPGATTPAFARRALVSDIMTWQYEYPDRFALHLEHDREFIPWMAARGINAFSYIRHERDTRLKIDELTTPLRQRGIAAEYGGHVLQLLLPRERFRANPELFPVSAGGERNPRGNLCPSNPEALAIVRDGAIAYMSSNPECALLHIWGADVWDGAWCRCSECARLSPPQQYLKVVNEIAEALAERAPVAYLAYHDTLEPDAALAPLPNVWFEWAPRERCYGHSIDDPSCAINPRYLESLKRYVELFNGRGHVFEYYGDAILFGGLGFATPGVIARDLRAYRTLGIRSVSCLTFGAYSVLAYPVNLEAFVRATRSPAFEPEQTFADVAAGLHPQCASEMAQAYRALGQASLLILNGGGDVMRPSTALPNAGERIAQLRSAHQSLTIAIAAADSIMAALEDRLGAAERAVWQYGREVVDGLSEYIAVAAEAGSERHRRAEAAIGKIDRAIAHVRALEPSLKGTWGAYDLEWVRDIWLAALRRRLGLGAT